MKYEGIINRYRQYLEIPGDLQPITLFEGDTPLIPVREITKIIDPSCELWIKYEGLNPTGSFKDRGMTVAVSEAAHRGAKDCHHPSGESCCRKASWCSCIWSRGNTDQRVI